MKHLQVRHSSLRGRFPLVISRENVFLRSPYSKPERESLNLSVDQFFSQKHNLRNGDIDTSPAAFDSPSAAGHVQFTQAEKPLPSSMSNDDIHGMVVSRHVQSLAEISRLSGLRPEQIQEPVPEPEPAPAADPVS